jgi:hypothetical protein
VLYNIEYIEGLGDLLQQNGNNGTNGCELSGAPLLNGSAIFSMIREMET